MQVEEGTAIRPIRVAFGFHFPNTGVTPLNEYRFNVTLQDRLRDIVGFKVLYFYLTRLASLEATPELGKVRVLHSRTLSNKSYINNYVLTDGTQDDASLTAVPHTDVIAFNVQTTGDITGAKTDVIPHAEAIQFVRPDIVESFDLYVDGLCEKPLAVSNAANSYVFFEGVIEFYQFTTRVNNF